MSDPAGDDLAEIAVVAVAASLRTVGLISRHNSQMGAIREFNKEHFGHAHLLSSSSSVATSLDVGTDNW